MDISIKQLRDNKAGVESLFYPVTHIKAVLDSDGFTLESKLGGLDSKYNNVLQSLQNIQTSTDNVLDNMLSHELEFINQTTDLINEEFGEIRDSLDVYEEEINAKMNAIRSEWDAVKGSLVATVLYGSAVTVRTIDTPAWSWLS